MLKKATAALLIVVSVLIAALFVLEMMGYTLFDKYSNMDGFVMRDDWEIHYADDPATVVEYADAPRETVRYIQPVKKYLFFKKAVNADDSYGLVTDDGEFAGFLYRFNGEKQNHYCFLAAWTADLNSIVNYGENVYGVTRRNRNLPENWFELDHVTVNGENCKLEKGAFFSTDKEFESFLLGDCELFLRPYEISEAVD